MLSSRQRRISASGAAHDDRAPGRAANPHEAALNARPQVAQLQAQAALLDRRPPPMQPIAGSGPVIQMVTFGKADERSQALFTTRTGLTGIVLPGGRRQPGGGQHQAPAAHQAAPAHQAPPANPPAIAHPPAIAANPPIAALPQHVPIVANPGNAVHPQPAANHVPANHVPGVANPANQAAIAAPPANAAVQPPPHQPPGNQAQLPGNAAAAPVAPLAAARHGAAAAAGDAAAENYDGDDFIPYHQSIREEFSEHILASAKVTLQWLAGNDANPDENPDPSDIPAWDRIDQMATLLKNNPKAAYAPVMKRLGIGSAYQIVTVTHDPTNCHGFASTGNANGGFRPFAEAFPRGSARLIPGNPPAAPHIGVWGPSKDKVHHSGIWTGGTTYIMKLPNLPVFTCPRNAYGENFLGYLPGNGSAAAGSAAAGSSAGSGVVAGKPPAASPGSAHGAAAAPPDGKSPKH